MYLLELVNRARSDPSAEAARLGIDLTVGLTPGELARLVPQEPLALNAALTMAARLHAQDMSALAYFAHENLDGLTPTDRANNAGYAGQGLRTFTVDADRYRTGFLSPGTGLSPALRTR